MQINIFKLMHDADQKVCMYAFSIDKGICLEDFNLGRNMNGIDI